MAKTWLAGASKVRAAMDAAGTVLTDEQAAAAAALFMPWAAGKEYAVDARARYEDILYKCLTAHTSQADWQPDVSPSLWVRVDDPAIEWPEWVQPLGSTDAYALGAKVSHNGKRWVSTAEQNTWEPGVYGWEEQA